jgi:hypothetical protein
VTTHLTEGRYAICGVDDGDGGKVDLRSVAGTASTHGDITADICVLCVKKLTADLASASETALNFRRRFQGAEKAIGKARKMMRMCDTLSRSRGTRLPASFTEAYQALDWRNR